MLRPHAAFVLGADRRLQLTPPRGPQRAWRIRMPLGCRWRVQVVLLRCCWLVSKHVIVVQPRCGATPVQPYRAEHPGQAVLAHWLACGSGFLVRQAWLLRARLSRTVAEVRSAVDLITNMPAHTSWHILPTPDLTSSRWSSPRSKLPRSLLFLLNMGKLTYARLGHEQDPDTASNWQEAHCRHAWLQLKG